jgi:ribosomal protein S18 acetylase RimI-like enzyme
MCTSRCLDPVPWETRNLGLQSFAITGAFLAKPDEGRLRAALAALRSAHGRFFVQARFKPDTNTSRILETNGFYFVETTLCPSLALTGYDVLDRFVADSAGVLPRRYQRSTLEVKAADRSDHEMAAAVRTIAGESFVDDRFHVDRNCPPDAASRRYRLWVDDLFLDGAVRYHVLLLRREPIAFMASRTGDLQLAGFARRYAGAGLGEFFWLSVLDRLRADGVTRVSTTISVTNVAVVNLYARLNFKFRDPKSTFHLWATG